uniref:CASPASE_P20 domain-containing protein n=1 Tax=Meloidogyne hapla TaxID=6305 RepID=A0A1I8BXW7_MELHA
MSSCFDLTTNLSQLSYGVFSQLSRHLDSQELWLDLFSDQEKNSAYSLSVVEKDKCLRLQEPGAYLLRLLGNRGQNVKSPVIWSRSEQIIVYIDKNEEECLENTTSTNNNLSIINHRLRLQCKASGFPTPRYQWLDDDRKLEGANQSSLIILRCPCTARNVFRCKIWNQVEENKEWSEFYRAPGKTFYSELISDIVDLSSFAVPFADCENCYKQKMEELAKRLGNEQTLGNNNNNLNLHEDDPMTTIAPEELIASDKVALIISNRSYAPNMTNLITPHCDAETLADALQQLNFKTVTLGDLNLSEMKQMINAYKKLLGEGVYAIFYFAGHGFEANGQCYLLPIGAPANAYGPQDCLSMDLVMNELRDFNPSLNLILLDMCRRFLPSNIDAFVAYSERFRKGEIRINRNTVYGYATSEGIGAYEVKGEMNGVFMKYLKKRIKQPRPLLDMLNKVFLDIERDPKVRDVQIPELRSNLTKQRTLLDPLCKDGHTTSYNHHTFHWRTMHGVYVFSSVEDLIPKTDDFQEFFEGKNKEIKNEGNEGEDGRMLVSDCKMPSEWALSHLAYLRFPEEFECSSPKMCKDDAEGVSLCVLLSHLQKAKGELTCIVEIKDRQQKLIATKENQLLGHVLITRIAGRK